MFKKNDDRLEPFIDGISMVKHHQSQLLPDCYKVNGVVDVFDTEIILNYENHYGNQIGYIETTYPTDIDIDNQEDLEYCEYLLEKQNGT
jgi:CMP-N-acetylneuraminic acid synthetase